jgi:hypothetical protein
MSFLAFCLYYLLVATTAYPLSYANNNGGGSFKVIVKYKTKKEADGFCFFLS